MFDHILVTPWLAERLTSATVRHDLGAADHHPLVATFTFDGHAALAALDQAKVGRDKVQAMEAPGEL